MKGPVKIVPPLYLLVCLIIMTLLHWLLPVSQLLESAWRFGAVVVLLAGLLTIIFAARLFHRLETPIRPFEQPQLLVTQGLFAYSRNPMYLGMVIFLIGYAVILGSLTPWLVIPVFVWLIQERFIKVEETGLEQAYGDTYRHYQQRVRRWL